MSCLGTLQSAATWQAPCQTHHTNAYLPTTCAAGGALAPLDPPGADLALPDLPCPSLDDELPPGPADDDFF